MPKLPIHYLDLLHQGRRPTPIQLDFRHRPIKTVYRLRQKPARRITKALVLWSTFADDEQQLSVLENASAAASHYDLQSAYISAWQAGCLCVPTCSSLSAIDKR